MSVLRIAQPPDAALRPPVPVQRVAEGIGLADQDRPPPGVVTRNTSVSSRIPLRCCAPRLSKTRSDPADRSRTVRLVRTSPGPAKAPMRAPVCTARPLHSSPWRSHSPVCTPARIRMPWLANAGTRSRPQQLRHRRARAGALHSCPLVPETGQPGNRVTEEQFGEHAVTPLGVEFIAERPKLLRRESPRVVGKFLSESGQSPVQDQRPDPFGKGGGEQDAHRATLGDSEEVGGRFQPGRIHDRVQIVHPLVERRGVTHRIGKSGSSLVERHDPQRFEEGSSIPGNGLIGSSNRSRLLIQPGMNTSVLSPSPITR